MSNLHQAQSHDVLRSWQSQRNEVDHHKDFVLPMFIGNDDDSIEAIESMPEVYRYGCNRAIEFLEPLVYSFGLRAVLLFPVVTKADHAKMKTSTRRGTMGGSDDEDDDEDGEDDEDDAGESGKDMISSSDSSASRSTPVSSSSSSSTDDDDELSANILPERLLPTEGTASDSTPNASQNPFLNQNEEEEDHLLGDQVSSRAQEAPKPPARQPVSAQIRRTDTPNLSKKVKALDVKLIKGLALREENNPVLRLIPRLTEKFPDLLIVCDVCLCAFTSTGHCCLFDDHVPQPVKSELPTNSFHHHHRFARPASHQAHPSSNYFPISNKISCQYLAMLAVEYALRGCSVVAPSDMMDGRILTIRESLNENRLNHVAILSYSAKFASAFYGPFRQATNNAPEFGDRKAYQLPPGSRAMALKAVERDIKQGADFVMVKPGGPYLDIVRDIREAHPYVPIAVYQVSGEYSMLKLAAKANILDLKLAVREMLTAYRRSGASIIISYFTPAILRGEL